MRPAGLGKRDANERDIIIALQLRGATVHQVGPAGPLDLVCGWRGKTTILEVKNPELPPSDRQLTSRETKFLTRWPGGLAKIVYTPEEACKAVFGNQRRATP